MIRAMDWAVDSAADFSVDFLVDCRRGFSCGFVSGFSCTVVVDFPFVGFRGPVDLCVIFSHVPVDGRTGLEK